MRFTETELSGAFTIELEPVTDERGFFVRAWCQNEFAKRGLETTIAQCNLSGNSLKGTLRGLHYQATHHEEVKLVRCTRGAVFDVMVDLRRDSETYLKWFACELTEENRKMLYVPKGFAHGFQTLCDGSEVFYQISQFYSPTAARGARWNDAAFGIRWPLPVAAISEKDRNQPDFEPE